MSKPEDTLETIDPTALTHVAGGARGASSAGDDSSAVTLALTGILDSIKSLASQQNNSSFGAPEMMLMMMMMQRGGGQVAAAPQPTNWTWDATGGYWIVK